MINETSTQANSYYDPYFVTTEDEGTTHVSVLDEDGNAVSATDTINYALVFLYYFSNCIHISRFSSEAQ